MSHSRTEFWHKKADFRFLNPEHRTGGYLKLIAAIGSLSAAGVAIYEMTSNPVLLTAAIGVWLFPIYIIAELYFKGGSAGATLMDEVDSAKATMTLSDASKVVRWMSRWMWKQSEVFEGDNDEYQQKLANEVHAGLLMSGDIVWLAQYAGPAHSQQAISRMKMSSAASDFLTASENLAIGKFDDKWKCSPELARLMAEMPFPERDTPGGEFGEIETGARPPQS